MVEWDNGTIFISSSTLFDSNLASNFKELPPLLLTLCSLWLDIRLDVMNMSMKVILSIFNIICFNILQAFKTKPSAKPWDGCFQKDISQHFYLYFPAHFGSKSFTCRIEFPESVLVVFTESILSTHNCSVSESSLFPSWTTCSTIMQHHFVMNLNFCQDVYAHLDSLSQLLKHNQDQSH